MLMSRAALGMKTRARVQLKVGTWSASSMRKSRAALEVRHVLGVRGSSTYSVHQECSYWQTFDTWSAQTVT